MRNDRELRENYVDESIRPLYKILKGMGKADNDVKVFCCEQSKNVKNSIKDQTMPIDRQVGFALTVLKNIELTLENEKLKNSIQ